MSDEKQTKQIDGATGKRTTSERAAQPGTKKRRRRQPPIDFGKLTDAQNASILRVVEIGAKIGQEQDAKRVAAEQAAAAALSRLLQQEEDQKIVDAVFARLLAAATSSEARKMMGHPRYPAGLAKRLGR